jgi:hypothetical protein
MGIPVNLKNFDLELGDKYYVEFLRKFEWLTKDEAVEAYSAQFKKIK